MTGSLRPTPRLLALAGAWLGLAILAGVVPALAALWQPAGLVLLGLILFDALRLGAMALPRLERRINHHLAIGHWQHVELTVHNPGAYPLNLAIFDHVPGRFAFEHQPQTGRVPGAGFLRLGYRVKPEARGNARFPGADLRLYSPWALWRRTVFVAQADAVRIYPDFAAVTRFALLATEERTGSLGVMRRQRRGEGLDFHQLREYREGDALRQIDWNASSRQKKLIAREYQEERDQQIVFLLDSGRRMRAEDAAHAHFDEALNATLLLAYVALRQGDAVGLMSFAGQERYQPPKKGLSTVNRLLNATYDLEPSLAPADYQAAARALDGRLKKRALVILLTNLRDDDADELLPAIRYLRRRHLVLIADLRESVLDAARDTPVADFDDALCLAAGEELRALRRELHERLNLSGVHMLDVTPAELPVRLVNRYLDIKASGLL